MLRWRLTFSLVFLVALAALCRLDVQAARPGIYLGALAVVAAALAAGEMLRMFRSGGHESTTWTVYLGTLLPVAASCAAVVGHDLPVVLSVGRMGGLAIGLAAGLSVALVGEMRRYVAPGQSAVRAALAALSVLYVGGLLGMLVQLRLISPSHEGEGTWRQLLPLLSLIATVKLSDTLQYAFGKLLGKHKLAPLLSPGKTWEGTIGGIATGSAVAAVGLVWLLHGQEGFAAMPLLTTSLFAVAVTVTGLVGDLAESMLKRDAGVKDSSAWLPGLGGVLDMLDSLLLSAPVAYCFWAFWLIG